MTMSIRPAACLCDKDLNHVEATHAQGWRAFAGQCCGCLNITDGIDGDCIHICDLPEFIAWLKAIQNRVENG